jgi:hypothetical protein
MGGTLFLIKSEGLGRIFRLNISLGGKGGKLWVFHKICPFPQSIGLAKAAITS